MKKCDGSVPWCRGVILSEQSEYRYDIQWEQIESLITDTNYGADEWYNLFINEVLF